VSSSVPGTGPTYRNGYDDSILCGVEKQSTKEALHTVLQDDMLQTLPEKIKITTLAFIASKMIEGKLRDGRDSEITSRR
jgi:hypothetical protein